MCGLVCEAHGCSADREARVDPKGITNVLERSPAASTAPSVTPLSSYTVLRSGCCYICLYSRKLRGERLGTSTTGEAGPGGAPSWWAWGAGPSVLRVQTEAAEASPLRPAALPAPRASPLPERTPQVAPCSRGSAPIVQASESIPTPQGLLCSSHLKSPPPFVLKSLTPFCFRGIFQGPE